MKRLHVSINVSDLPQSIRFYSTLFSAEPTVVHDDYAKWMLDDPRVNFVLERSDGQPGFGHAGIQAESEAELESVLSRMQSAEAPYLDEGETTCCYARSTKGWTADPDGLMWEGFFTHHQTETRGEAVAPVVEAGGCGTGTCC